MIEAEKANNTAMTVSRMCRLLRVDRRRFYEWRARQAAGPSLRQQRAAELTAQIREFHDASEGTYGAPRIHADLQDTGVVVSRKMVAKLMREDGITGISPATWHPPTTVPGADPFPVPDLVERRFDQGSRDLARFSDITYLRTGEGWAYLCVVREGHTRGVLGRTVAENMHTDLVVAALRQAVALRGAVPRKVIFHADRVARRIQLVVATPPVCSKCRYSSSASAGVRQPSRFRGRVFSAWVTAARSSWVQRERSVPFGKYCRSNPFVFSLVPRCQGL